MESSAPKLPESAEASTYSPEGAPMSADEWLKSELIRIALSDDLHDATELKNLQVAAPRYGLKLEIPALKKKLKELRAAAADADREGLPDAKHDALIKRLNNEYFVFHGGDKVTIGSWKSQEGRRVLVQRSQQDFALLLAKEPEIFSPILGKRVSAAKAWLHHPDRREVKDFIFEADLEIAAKRAKDGYENLFEGFSVVPAEGDIKPFLKHLMEVIVAEEPEDRRDEIVKYLLDCMANLVQRPGTPLKVAILLRGEQGAGKSFVSDVITSLFRGNTFETSHADDIVGRFNMHLMTSALVVGDEAVFAGSKKDADTMKRLITQDKLRVEGKHKDILNVRNRMTFLLTSNHDHAAHIEPRDRRFFVVNVSDAKTPRSLHEGYWSELWAWAKSAEGRAALLHHLLERDISQFDAQRDRPRTQAHFEQVLHSLSGVYAWLLENGIQSDALRQRMPGELRISDELRSELEDGATVLSKNSVYKFYQESLAQNKRNEKPKHPTAFWKEMKRLLGKDAVTRRRIDRVLHHILILPRRDEVIRRFVEALGHDAEHVHELLDIGANGEQKRAHPVALAAVSKLKPLRARAR